MISFVVLATAAALPSPTRMLVEYLSDEASEFGPPVVSTATPRFSFLPHTEYDHPGKGVVMTAYRIVVTNPSIAGKASIWDSGIVNASAAVSVKCGEPLASLTTYEWSAQWWQQDQASPISTAKFDVR